MVSVLQPLASAAGNIDCFPIDVQGRGVIRLFSEELQGFGFFGFFVMCCQCGCEDVDATLMSEGGT